MSHVRLLLSTTLLASLAGGTSADRTTFRYVPYAGEEATAVSLRGSMNGWGETPFDRLADGTWMLTVDLDPGEYEYKFFLNGEWPKDMENAHGGDPVDPEADAYGDDGHGGQNALRIIGDRAPAHGEARPPAPPLGEGLGRIHYHRPDGRYSGWGLHLWEETLEEVAWNAPLPPAGEDPFGLYWDFRMNQGAKRIGFIVHKGDRKDPGPDLFFLPQEHGAQIWLASGSGEIHTEEPDLSGLACGDLRTARAHWLAAGTLLWKRSGRSGETYRLHSAPEGGLTITEEGVAGGEDFLLTADPNGLAPEIHERFPHLGRRGVLRFTGADRRRIARIVKGQIAISATGPDGKLRRVTAVQIPGLLDDLFRYDGPLGVTWERGACTIRLWAPTAKEVSLLLFETPRAPSPWRKVAMVEEGGVWRAEGGSEWKRKYYLYEVRVYVPSTGKVETNLVTDPYSRSLSANSARSQIVDLADPDLAPAGWDRLEKPPLRSPEEIVLYELHMRDFSALDPTVPQERRGTYLAFEGDGNGIRHLRALAAAGLTHVHLLPVFDIAMIDEEKAHWKDPGELGRFSPDSEEQQKALSAVKDADGYNWGYDPYHFGVPEGSYATDPDGTTRIVEFRRMVRALSEAGLRVVLDVVYNHTSASGQSERSVFDKIVPGYYHRLDAAGNIETSTCCRNTASEHDMMERFMIDDLVHWAKDYKIDGFRFDLMGHHMKANLEKARRVLSALTPERDGVDGSKIYLYGEGWNFGEVADGRRGVNATQQNMYGTGIGTFNDRMRDAIRGGNAFGDPAEPGFASGLADDAKESDRERLLDAADRIRIGLAGNLRDFRFVSHGGDVTSGGNYAAVGYAAVPRETINYASAHDNQTLFDKIAFAAPAGVDRACRIRMQNLAVDLVGLGQGIPFFHAGVDLLRSKSLDGDSYNSGDWFNRLDFSYGSNNFGVGLPPAEKNRDRWPVMRTILSRAELRPGREEIAAAAEHFRETLAIRKSSPLFRLATLEDVQNRVRFWNTGPRQIPGLIVMSIDDDDEGMESHDRRFRAIAVLFNAGNEPREFQNRIWEGASFELHPVQAASGDPVVREASFDAHNGTFRVPPRTAAVFVERR